MHVKLTIANEILHSDLPYFQTDPIEPTRTDFEKSRKNIVIKLYPADGDTDDDEAGSNELDHSNMGKLFKRLMKHTTQVIQGSKNAPSIRRPSIDIPKFDGNLRNFRSFDETFTMVVRRSNDYDVEKLALLRGKLAGEALELVPHLAITEANYERTWEMLRERYLKEIEGSRD